MEPELILLERRRPVMAAATAVRAGDLSLQAWRYGRGRAVIPCRECLTALEHLLSLRLCPIDSSESSMNVGGAGQRTSAALQHTVWPKRRSSEGS